MSNTTIAPVDNQTQLINLFNLLIKTFSQCLDGFGWIIGNIGAILTCLVFYQAPFRKSPCAIYFIVSSFSQLFIFNFATFIRMIQYGYGVPVNSVPSWFCKMRFYIYYVAMASARYNIIFASADRYFCSSHKLSFRRLSSSKIAFRLNVINIIVWALFYIQILIFFDVTSNKCRIGTASIVTYFNYYITFENGFLPIIPMMIFGLLTIHNIHQSKRRIRTTEPNNEGQNVPTDRVPKKEAQLHKMLVNQIIVYIIFNIPLPAYSVYRLYINLTSLSGWRALMATFINNLCFDMIYLGYALTFTNFVLTSDIFRRELKLIIQTNIYRPCRRHITHTN